MIQHNHALYHSGGHYISIKPVFLNFLTVIFKRFYLREIKRDNIYFENRYCICDPSNTRFFNYLTPDILNHYSLKFSNNKNNSVRLSNICYY